MCVKEQPPDPGTEAFWDDVIDGLRREDWQAYLIFLRHYESLIYGWLRARGVQKDEALDLTASIISDVLLAIINKYQKRPGCTLNSYVWAIVTRQYASWCKKNVERLKMESHLTVDISVVVAEEEDESEATIQKHTHIRHIMQWAIAQLSENLQSVIYLIYFERMSSKEVGEKLGLSDSTVRVYHLRAKEELLKLLSSLIDE